MVLSKILNSVLSFQITLNETLIVLIVIWLVLFNFTLNHIFEKVDPIKKQTFKTHSTKSGFGSKQPDAPKRVYIIAGGSGFIGSWIARYLLFRGDKVFLFDTEKPPSDLLKYGANWVEVDLTFSFGVIHELKQIISQIDLEKSSIIIYNCSVRKRYELPNFRADLGVATSENLYISLNTIPLKRVFIIHIGDCLSHREPIKNLDRFWPTSEVWCQKAVNVYEVGNGDKKQESRDRAFSSYAWHQLQVEQMTRRAPTMFPAVAGSAVLRVDGFASGHIGDGFLSPLILKHFALTHSENVPLTIVNIEDVARAALSVEHLLLDPQTRPQTNQQCFVVGSTEVTTLAEVFKLIKKRRSFMVLSIYPALMYAATWLMSIVYMGKPVAKRTAKDSLLRTTLPTMSFSRFYSCQVGQVPNEINIEHQHKVLQLQNNYSLYDTINNLLDDIEEYERIKGAK